MFVFIPSLYSSYVIQGDGALLGQIGRASILCKGRESGLGNMEERCRSVGDSTVATQGNIEPHQRP